MGFRKPLYDVEEKGLDPEIPHTNLGSDGRLLPAEENLGTPTAVSSSKKTDLDKVKVEAVPKATETAAKTPQSANKANDKKAVDKLDDAKQELPDVPQAEKKSSTKKKVTRTRKTTPKAKADKKTTAKKSSTTSSKAKTTRKKASS